MKYSITSFLAAIALTCGIMSCNNNNGNTSSGSDSTKANNSVSAYDTNFKVEAEAFADLQILRYQVPGFNDLSLQQKQLAYYLTEAALCGRDIIYDQKSKYGIMLR